MNPLGDFLRRAIPPLPFSRSIWRGEVQPGISQEFAAIPCVADSSRTICSYPALGREAPQEQEASGFAGRDPAIVREARPAGRRETGYLRPANSRCCSCGAHFLCWIKHRRLLAAIHKQAVYAINAQPHEVVALRDILGLKRERSCLCGMCGSKDLLIAQEERHSLLRQDIRRYVCRVRNTSCWRGRRRDRHSRRQRKSQLIRDSTVRVVRSLHKDRNRVKTSRPGGRLVRYFNFHLRSRRVCFRRNLCRVQPQRMVELHTDIRAIQVMSGESEQIS